MIEIDDKTRAVLQGMALSYLSLYRENSEELFAAMVDKKSEWRCGYNDVDDYYWCVAHARIPDNGLPPFRWPGADFTLLRQRYEKGLA